MLDLRAIAAACLLSTNAIAEPVDHPTPIPVPHGLIFYPDPIGGKHAFGPADGVDVLPGGKADWSEPPSARATVTMKAQAVAGYASGYRERRVPDLPLPPLCCGRSADPPSWQPMPPNVPQVPLPASLWLLAGALGMLFRRALT